MVTYPILYDINSSIILCHINNKELFQMAQTDIYKSVYY